MNEMTTLVNVPELPVEIWDHVIDTLAGACMSGDDAFQLDDEARKELSSCSLVCRAWGPRCRLYLFREIDVISRDSLRSISTFLQKSPSYAGLVEQVNICAKGTDQSWVPTVPLLLPNLSGLYTLSFTSVDFKQQHPRFSQFYSRLRFEQFPAVLVTSDAVASTPFQMASLAAALDCEISISDSTRGDAYMVQTTSDVMCINSWTPKLASYMRFRTEGTPQELLKILPGWRYPVKTWAVTIEATTENSPEELVKETEMVWQEIARVASLRYAVSVDVYTQGLGPLYLDSYLGTGTSIPFAVLYRTELIT